MGYPLFLTARFFIRLLLAALFIFAGTVHLLKPKLFFPIMPPWIPFPYWCIIVSGVFELMGGAGLLVLSPRMDIFIGWGLAFLLLAVFPANIYMAMANIKVHGIPAQPWVAWARLPLQPLLIAAVLWVTGIWPKAAA